LEQEVAPAAENLPASQLVHAAPAVEVWPAAQLVQSLTVAEPSAEDLPAAQLVAVCAPVPGRAVPPAMYVPTAAFAMMTALSAALAAEVIL